MRKLINSLIFKHANDILTDDYCFDNYIVAAQAGDEKAKNEIVAHTVKLVAKIANKYADQFNYDAEELFSVGCYALAKAINSFDIVKGVQFSSYLTRCVSNEILMLFRHEKYYMNKSIISFDDVLNPTSMEDDNDLSYLDKIPDPDANVFIDVDNKIFIEECSAFLKANLSERDYYICSLYFGFDGNDTHKIVEIAQITGLKRLNCDRIVKQARVKLAARFNSSCSAENNKTT